MSSFVSSSAQQCFSDASILFVYQHVMVLFLLSYVPLYEYSKIGLSILLLMEICGVSSFWRFKAATI